MPILPLRCAVQHYAWGSTTSIPTLTQRPNPEEKPWAELWMGAHPRACSTLPDGQSLMEFIRAKPEEVLGPSAKDFDSTLPFLFKILAAARPLSIQCHPNLSQAQAGFAAENAAGLALDAPDRNYRDANHKPELIVALEEFWALKGFREPAEIRRLLKAAELTTLDPLSALLSDEDGLSKFFQALLSLSKDQKTATLSELRTGASKLPEAESRWTRELLERYPDDVACVAVLVLQLVRLEAGQGLYLGAGELHAYLRGTGLEIMANSDNVLRGGLTPKHVDVEELMRVLIFEHKPLEILSPSPESPEDKEGLLTYPTACPEFSLSCIALQEKEAYEHDLHSAAIFLSLGESAELAWAGNSLTLAQGGVAFATADTKAVQMCGKGQLWIASIGA